MIGFAFLTAHSCQFVKKMKWNKGRSRVNSQGTPAEAQMRDGYGLDQKDGSEHEEK